MKCEEKGRIGVWKKKKGENNMVLFVANSFSSGKFSILPLSIIKSKKSNFKTNHIPKTTAAT